MTPTQRHFAGLEQPRTADELRKFIRLGMLARDLTPWRACCVACAEKRKRLTIKLRRACRDLYALEHGPRWESNVWRMGRNIHRPWAVPAFLADATYWQPHQPRFFWHRWDMGLWARNRNEQHRLYFALVRVWKCSDTWAVRGR